MVGARQSLNTSVRWSRQRGSTEIVLGGLQSLALHEFRQQEIWCQRRDSNSQTPVSKTGCYSNSHTLALWCTGEDLNLRVPLGETGLQPVRFGRAHAPVQTWRKVDESNAHRSSRCPGFQDQLPTNQRYLPHGGEYGS